MKKITESQWIQNDKIKLPEGHQEFIIGDIHGDIDNLTNLVSWKERNYPNAVLTSIGDVIDRGKDSLGCLKLVLEKFDNYIPGNHEILMLGGLILPQNYGGYLEIFYSNGGKWLIDILMTRPNIPPLTVLEELLGTDKYNRLIQDGDLLLNNPTKPKISRRIGNLFLVHAGINPDMTTIHEVQDWVDRHSPYQLMNDHPLWIREKFLNHKGSFVKDENGDEIIVVHGHSFEHYVTHDLLSSSDHGPKWPYGYTRIDGYRLGLDTGSFATGILTGCLIENGRYKIINSH